MKINSPRQLKDWINNMAKNNNLIANTLLQNFIIKGGFLIAAIVGLDMRSTMDIDSTIKDMKNIHDISEYDDFRVSVEASLFTIKVNMKIDITTGDIIIPREIDYSFKLMFEDRSIIIKAYNINTILAEKIESILSRNIANTRARDYYDVYILMTLKKNEIDLINLKNAIMQKAEDRNTIIYVKNKDKYLSDIDESEYLKTIWKAYTLKFPYAKDIQFTEITNIIKEILL